MVLACFRWVNEQREAQGEEEREDERESEAGLPAVTKKEKDRKVRRNVLDLELCV